MDKMAYGGGGRFKAMVASGKSPALAAYIGRRAHGARSMAKVAARGRERAEERREHGGR